MTPIELLQKIYTETSLENFWSAEDLQEGNEALKFATKKHHTEIVDLLKSYSQDTP